MLPRKAKAKSDSLHGVISGSFAETTTRMDYRQDYRAIPDLGSGPFL